MDTQQFSLKDYLNWFSTLSKYPVNKAQLHPNFWSDEILLLFITQNNKRNLENMLLAMTHHSRKGVDNPLPL